MGKIVHAVGVLCLVLALVVVFGSLAEALVNGSQTLDKCQDEAK
jgi:hypothetical protein